VVPLAPGVTNYDASGFVFLEGGVHLLDELGSLLDTYTNELLLILAYDE
jgi:hypothetical protein